ncbi:MAG TPA: hypothetical protein VH478_01715 [Trebonia sp.]|nr:hypothetical protein [Trebonia sp.]
MTDTASRDASGDTLMFPIQPAAAWSTVSSGNRRSVAFIVPGSKGKRKNVTGVTTASRLSVRSASRTKVRSSADPPPNCTNDRNPGGGLTTVTARPVRESTTSADTGSSFCWGMGGKWVSGATIGPAAVT